MNASCKQQRRPFGALPPLWARTHARARFSAYASVPVHSHPVINISAVSIIDRWISPLRCTKIIQTFLCWNWSINISTGCLFVERLKGWKARCALLSFASFALCCGNEKHTSLSCLPAPNIFFSTFTLHSLWYIRCSFALSFVSLTYLSSLLCYICTSFPLPLWDSCIHLNPGRFPGGGNLQETPAADLFIVVHAYWLCTCVFVHCL